MRPREVSVPELASKTDWQLRGQALEPVAVAASVGVQATVLGFLGLSYIAAPAAIGVFHGSALWLGAAALMTGCSVAAGVLVTQAFSRAMRCSLSRGLTESRDLVLSPAQHLKLDALKAAARRGIVGTIACAAASPATLTGVVLLRLADMNAFATGAAAAFALGAAGVAYSAYSGYSALAERGRTLRSIATTALKQPEPTAEMAA